MRSHTDGTGCSDLPVPLGLPVPGRCMDQPRRVRVTSSAAKGTAHRVEQPGTSSLKNCGAKLRLEAAEHPATWTRSATILTEVDCNPLTDGTRATVDSDSEAVTRLMTRKRTQLAQDGCA